MDVEKTIEYILQLQAKSEERHARTEAELEKVAVSQNRTERNIDRLERNLTRLARLGVKSRSKINGRLDDHQQRVQEHDRWFAEQKLLMHEIGEKLNAMIDYVDRLPRNPPQS